MSAKFPRGGGAIDPLASSLLTFGPYSNQAPTRHNTNYDNNSIYIVGGYNVFLPYSPPVNTGRLFFFFC